MDQAKAILHQFLNTNCPLDWESLYSELMPRVFQFFLYRFKDVQLSQDLTSTTFTKAWKGRLQYRGEFGSFENWLFAIAHNVAIDHLRRMHYRYELNIEDISDVQDEFDIENLVIRYSNLLKLSQLLQNLSKRDQEIISLKFLLGMSNKAIAKRLALGESNVSTIVFRVLRRLRGQWAGMETGRSITMSAERDRF
jgi:RNA polymerase sigma-70 factor (ECF subfamily)